MCELTSHNNLNTSKFLQLPKRVNNQATGGIRFSDCKQSFHLRTLKWKSQETMKAKTMAASKKFITRRPCHIPRGGSVWAWVCPAAACEWAEAVLSGFDCSPATFIAIAPHISHVLLRFIETIWWRNAKYSLKDLRLSLKFKQTRRRSN